MLILASSHIASAFLAGSRPYGNARTAPVRMSVSGTVPEGTYSTVVFLRHGQSEWNEANLFTGWADVPLTTLGKNEAATGATWGQGDFSFENFVLGPFFKQEAVELARDAMTFTN